MGLDGMGGGIGWVDAARGKAWLRARAGLAQLDAQVDSWGIAACRACDLLERCAVPAWMRLGMRGAGRRDWAAALKAALFPSLICSWWRSWR